MTLRGASVESVKAKCSTGGQRQVEIRMTAAWSDVVCREMQWIEVPTGFGKGALEGELAAVNIIWEPSDKRLLDYRFDMTISKVNKFKHVTETKDGEITSRHLQFVVTTIADDALEVMDQWLKFCGPAAAKGQCKIRYEAEKQLELGDGDAPPIAAEGDEKPRGRRGGKAAEGVQ